MYHKNTFRIFVLYKKSVAGRGGRAAEGNGLLNRHTHKRVSRVRISPSPLKDIYKNLFSSLLHSSLLLSPFITILTNVDCNLCNK